MAELDARHLAGREDHRRDRRHEQQLDDPRLRQGDVGADRVAGRSAAPAAVVVGAVGRGRSAVLAAGVGRRRPGLVVARPRRAPTSAAQISAPSARWSVCVQPRGPVRICRPPMTAWIGNRTAAIEREPDDRPVRALRPPRRDGRPRRRSGRRRSRPSDGGRGPTLASVSGGKSEPFISGQSGKTNHCDVAVTCDPNRSSANTDPAPERGKQREPLAAPRPADPRRVERPGEDADEQPDERHRRREMGRHGLAGVAEPDGLAAQPRLEPDEQRRRPIDGHEERPARSRWSRTATKRQAKDLEADRSRRRSGGPTRSRPGSRRRREELALEEPGQCGQPMPEPVARTMTPIVTSRSVVTTVAAASFWKRVNELSSGTGRPSFERRSSGPTRPADSSANAPVRAVGRYPVAMTPPRSPRRRVAVRPS